MIVVRYADDAVRGFQYRADAERLLEELQERMRKFGLELHPDKTRLIEFGRYAAERREKHGEGKPETFDFLGFTHIRGRLRTSRQFTVRRKTVAKRLTAKRKDIQQKLKRRLREGTERTGDWLQSVVRGYLNYHAIPGNFPALHRFRREVIRHWWMALRRRSQRSRYPWEKFARLVERWIPKAKILHPYPHVRFDVKHPRQEPCAVRPLARICAGGAQ